jgi:hypothetical protein
MPAATPTTRKEIADFKKNAQKKTTLGKGRQRTIDNIKQEGWAEAMYSPATLVRRMVGCLF